MKRSKGLRRTKGPKRGKRSQKSAKARERDEKRTAERFRRQFHSQEFVEWSKDQPCVRCEALSLDQWSESQPHHDPQRGNGGTWEDVSPLCHDCHTMGPNARHGPNSGVDSFWTFGITYTEANAEHNARFLAYTEGE